MGDNPNRNRVTCRKGRYKSLRNGQSPIPCLPGDWLRNLFADEFSTEMTDYASPQMIMRMMMMMMMWVMLVSC